MLKAITAGESHGKGLVAIVEGLPAGVRIERERIAEYMKARQSGYGRGGRQKIETDSVEFLSGIRANLTLGSPVTMFIRNRDYENWSDVMGDEKADVSKRIVTAPRPGHADLVGALKYGFTDCRNVLERASARETASRVAVGALCINFLNMLGIRSVSRVIKVGGETDTGRYTFEEIESGVKSSEIRAAGAESSARMIAKIDEAREKKDTVGGMVEVRIRGVKPGLGSYVQSDRKLDAALAAALMSVQAIKSVSVGDGEKYADAFGSEVLDEIYGGEDGYYRKTNHAGGIEGGMSNGEEIVLTAVMKPIPTLRAPLKTVDLQSGLAVSAAFERSDICAVAAASVICECAACFEIAKFILQAVGKSNMGEILKLWKECKCL